MDREDAVEKVREVALLSPDTGEELAETVEEEVGWTIEVPRTHSPGRHSFEYCLLCNPSLNGKWGKDGTEAVGKYYVENEPGHDQFATGWHGVCVECAEMLQRQGTNVIPLDGHENRGVFTEEDVPEHRCDDPSWTKHSLVTEEQGFDWVQCDECSYWAKRWGMDDIEECGPERPF